MDSAAQPEDTAVTTNDRTVTEHSEHEESFEYHEYHDFSSEDASAKAPLDFHIIPLITWLFAVVKLWSARLLRKVGFYPYDRPVPRCTT